MEKEKGLKDKYSKNQIVKGWGAYNNFIIIGAIFRLYFNTHAYRSLHNIGILDLNFEILSVSICWRPIDINHGQWWIYWLCVLPVAVSRSVIIHLCQQFWAAKIIQMFKNSSTQGKFSRSNKPSLKSNSDGSIILYKSITQIIQNSSAQGWFRWYNKPLHTPLHLYTHLLQKEYSEYTQE